MKTAFIIDPLHLIKPDHDSSVALMEASFRREHQVFVIQVEDIFFSQGKTRGILKKLEMRPGCQPWCNILETVELPLSEMQAVWMRKDPPVDMNYIYATQLLDLLPAHKTLVLNRPSALRAYNEKLSILPFPNLIPRTIVSANKEKIIDFVSQEKETVIKPLAGKGGVGVFLLRWDDPNLMSLVQHSTNMGQTPVMVQEYLPDAENGDKRIILLDGQPLGAIVRKAGSNDFRGNVDSGGQAFPAGINDAEMDLCRQLGLVFKREGIYFAGIDVIGEKLTEINLTSPTMLREISQENGVSLEDAMIQWLEKKVLEGKVKG